MTDEDGDSLSSSFVIKVRVKNETIPFPWIYFDVGLRVGDRSNPADTGLRGRSPSFELPPSGRPVVAKFGIVTPSGEEYNALECLSLAHVSESMAPTYRHSMICHA